MKKIFSQELKKDIIKKERGTIMNETEKEKIFQELQAEIKAGIEAYERGGCIPLEEIIASLNSTN